MNAYLIMMFASWLVVALIILAAFLDNVKRKYHVTFQLLWFITMGLPPIAKLWILGVMT